MKNYIVLCIAFAVLSILAKAQEPEFITAKGAYNAVLQSSEMIPNYELISITAIGYLNIEFTEIDFEAGTSTFWYVDFKSKNPNNQTIYSYSVYKIDGKYSVSFDDSFDGAQYYTAISSEWLDSDELSVACSQNSELINFYNLNKDDFIYLQYYLYYDELDGKVLWQASVVASASSSAECRYLASNLEQKGCNLPSSVENIVTDIKLYPSPSYDYINVDLPFEGFVLVEIYNSNGESVQTQELYIGGTFQLNTSKLTNGVYNLLVIYKGISYSTKVVLAK